MPRLALRSGFALLLALAASLAACDSAGDIVGTWMPVGPLPEGAGSARTTFFADGSARIVVSDAPGAAEAYDARYTVSGDTALTLSSGRTSERFRLRIARDTLVLTSPAAGTSQTFARVRG